MYTYEEYLDIASKYIGSDEVIKPFLINNVLHGYCEEIGKTPIDFDVLDLFEYFKRRNIKHVVTAARYTSIFRSFYDYLIGRNIVQGGNICNDAQFVPANMVQSVVEYFDPHDIDIIMTKVDSNRDFYEALIRSAYEGIAGSYTELYSLNKSDIDYDALTIQMCRGEMPISSKLADAYRGMANIEFFEEPHPRSRTGYRRIVCYYPYPSSVFPTTWKSTKNFIKQKFIKLSELTDHELSIAAIYHSGFINTIINDVGLEKCMELLSNEGRMKSDDITILKNAIESFKLNLPFNKVKYYYRRYVAVLQKKYDCH